LHQAARRQSSASIARLLLDHGADPSLPNRGHTPYALARVHGNQPMARVLEEAGAATPLTAAEASIATAVDGTAGPADWIRMEALTDELRLTLCRMVWRPGTLEAMKRLVALGFDANQADEMGLPPVHLAGWEGLSDKFAWLMSLGPDMAHVNGYGGTLFSTILHGSENCPARAERDHLACMRLALEHGVAIPKDAIQGAVDDEMGAFLAEWAEARPGQVVEDGVW
ncbi:MAG: hypothetical protein AAFX00_13115, partial [Pseudomonadota bacterium]